MNTEKVIRVIVMGLATAGFGVVALMAGRGIAFPDHRLETMAMSPTIGLGDKVVFSRFSKPEPGDVVVMTSPRDGSTMLVSRLIGMPGDRVQIKEGVLHINGVAVRTREVSAGAAGRLIEESLPGDATYRVLDSVPQGPGDNTKEYVTPPGAYFFLGDYRDGASDSRAEQNQGGLGFVPKRNLSGVVVEVRKAEVY